MEKKLKIFFIFHTLAFLISIDVLSSLKNPIITNQFSQNSLLRVARLACNETLTKLEIWLNPRDQKIELRGNLKVDFYKFLNSGTNQKEYSSRSYPEGYPFKLVIKPQVLPDRIVRIYFDSLTLLEGEMSTFINEHNIRFFFGLTKILLTDTPLKNLIEKDENNNLLYISENYIQLRLNPDYFLKKHDHWSISDLQVWSLAILPDHDTNENYLQISFGEGPAAKSYLNDIQLKIFESKSFTGIWKSEKTGPAPDLKKTLSLDYLNMFLKNYFNFRHQTEEFKKDYLNKDATDIKTLTFNVSSKNILVLDLHLKKLIKGRRLWQTLWTERGSDREEETTLNLTSSMELLENNIVKLIPSETITYNGMSASGKLLEFVLLFKNQIIKLIDDPEDENDFLNSYMKLYINDQKEIVLELNPRMFISSLDHTFSRGSIRLDNKTNSVSFEANINVPITSTDKKLALKTLEEISARKKWYENSYLDPNLRSLEFDFFGKTFNTLMLFRKFYEPPTSTGLELAYITVLAKELSETMILYGEKTNLTNDRNLQNAYEIYKQLVEPNFALLNSKYFPQAPQLSKKGKTDWNELFFDDASELNMIYHLYFKY